METILTLTLNPSLDESTAVDRVTPERKLRCAAARREPGGGGINVSRAIRQMGGDSTALYVAGGPNGAALSRLVEAQGVRTLVVPVAGETRQSFTVFETTTTLQYRFTMPGAELRESEWQACLDAIQALVPRPAYIVASGSLPPGVPEDFYARVAHAGRAIGARVIVDTSGAPLLLAAEAGVFLLKPNLRELADLMQCQEDAVEVEAAAQELVRKGETEVVVVSLGAGGVFWMAGGRAEQVASPTVPIRSKVGAGDSTVAGIVLSLARGNSLPQAVRYGVAAGAATVMTPGSELCRGEDVERLYWKIPGVSPA